MPSNPLTFSLLCKNEQFTCYRARSQYITATSHLSAMAYELFTFRLTQTEFNWIFQQRRYSRKEKAQS